MRNENWKAFLAIIATAIVGAIQGVFVKIAVRQIPPFSLTFVRFLLSLLFVFPLIFRERIFFKKEVIKVALISLLATANIILFAFAMRLTGAIIAGIIYTAVPILTVFLSFFILKEGLEAKKIVGITCGLIGTLLVIIFPLQKTSVLKGNFIGNILIFIGAISFSFYSILSKKYHGRYSPVHMTIILIVSSVIASLFFVPFDFQTSPHWVNSISSFSIVATLVVVVATIGYYFLYQYAIKHGTALIASISIYLQPIAVVIVAGIFLSERLNSSLLLGGLLTLFGAWLVTSTKNQNKA